MKKRIAIAVTLFVVLGLAAGLALGLWLEYGRRGRPQIITAQNGQQYRFVGVTYGTNHIMGSRLGKMVARLPRPVAGFVRGVLGKYLGPTQTKFTLKPSLCVWLESVGPGTTPGAYTTVYALLADESGTVAGGQYVSGFISLRWMDAAAFDAIPHRSRHLECRFFEYSATTNFREMGSVRFDNPVFGQFPQWPPAPAAPTAMAGDLEVRVDHFVTGVSGSTTPSGGDGGTAATYPPAAAGEEPHAAFDLDFRPAHSNQVWTLQGAVLSDATGNHVRAHSWSASENHFSIGPTLWPGEAAWRLKVNLKRSAGFDANELVAFKGVAIPAIGATNHLSITNESGGVRVALKEFTRRPDITGSSWNSSQATEIHFENSALPKDQSLDFVGVDAGADHKVEVVSQTRSDNNYTISIKTLPPGVDHVDVTFAVQKTRTAEFMVNPVQIRH